MILLSYTTDRHYLSICYCTRILIVSKSVWLSQNIHQSSWILKRFSHWQCFYLVANRVLSHPQTAAVLIYTIIHQPYLWYVRLFQYIHITYSLVLTMQYTKLLLIYHRTSKNTRTFNAYRITENNQNRFRVETISISLKVKWGFGRLP